MIYMVSIWVVMILVGIGAVVWGVLAEKKRRQAIAQTVEELGLRLASDLDESDRDFFDACQLAQQGHSRQVSNVIVADSGELRMVLFDYVYKISSGKNSTTYRQSVVIVRSPTLRMPQFTLSPEGFFHRILEMFGTKDIDFEEDRPFSDRFLLHGTQEQEVRNFFNAQRRRQFANHANLHLESRAGSFLYYRPRYRWDADKIKQAMEQAFEVYRILSAE